MDIALLLKALIMGIVEGLTEFLPVSSTGHLILVGDLLDFNDDKAKVFDIVIQAGAILAVCWEYRAKLVATLTGITHDNVARQFALNVFIAFLPLAGLAFLFNHQIKALLFKPVPVALAFIVGGVIILFAEHWTKKREARGITARINHIDDMRWQDALMVGIAQCAALIPGMSRSGSTIIGGMFFGFSRRTVTEFTFFLAIPTLFAATIYSLWKARALLSVADLPMFVVGFAAAFVSALVVVRWLIRYVSTHDFTVFAWYRIVFGLLVLWTAHSGMVTWSAN